MSRESCWQDYNKENSSILEQQCLSQVASDFHVVPISVLNNLLWTPYISLPKIMASKPYKDLAEKGAPSKVDPCSGIVTIIAEATMTLFCQMKFQWYPFDVQVSNVL